MSTVSKTILLGNVGSIDVKTFGDGGKIANISLATTETWKDKQNGQKKEETEWHRLVIHGPQAEIAERYIQKGNKLYVEGRIKSRKYQANDGTEKIVTEIMVREFNMLGGKNEGGAAPKPQPPAPQQPAQAPQPQADMDDFSDDIPFS